MIEVAIGPHKANAMLDTGARPSVVDMKTASELGLQIIPSAHRVYGLCNNQNRAPVT